MDDQDWTLVTVRGKKSTTVTTPVNHVSNKAAELRKVEKTEAGKPKMLTAKSRADLAAVRMAKKLTQKELDKQCSFPLNSCNSWEAGRMCPSSTQIQSLHRVLNIKLERE
jgi:ribosome-binding protein aMBF1 (putative translation factor)